MPSPIYPPEERKVAAAAESSSPQSTEDDNSENVLLSQSPNTSGKPVPTSNNTSAVADTTNNNMNTTNICEKSSATLRLDFDNRRTTNTTFSSNMADCNSVALRPPRQDVNNNNNNKSDNNDVGDTNAAARGGMRLYNKDKNYGNKSGACTNNLKNENGAPTNLKDDISPPVQQQVDSADKTSPDTLKNNNPDITSNLKDDTAPPVQQQAEVDNNTKKSPIAGNKKKLTKLEKKFAKVRKQSLMAAEEEAKKNANESPELPPSSPKLTKSPANNNSSPQNSDDSSKTEPLKEDQPNNNMDGVGLDNAEDKSSISREEINVLPPTNDNADYKNEQEVEVPTNNNNDEPNNNNDKEPTVPSELEVDEDDSYQEVNEYSQLTQTQAVPSNWGLGQTQKEEPGGTTTQEEDSEDGDDSEEEEDGKDEKGKEDEVNDGEDIQFEGGNDVSQDNKSLNPFDEIENMMNEVQKDVDKVGGSNSKQPEEPKFSCGSTIQLQDSQRPSVTGQDQVPDEEQLKPPPEKKGDVSEKPTESAQAKGGGLRVSDYKRVFQGVDEDGDQDERKPPAKQRTAFNNPSAARRAMNASKKPPPANAAMAKKKKKGRGNKGGALAMALAAEDEEPEPIVAPMNNSNDDDQKKKRGKKQRKADATMKALDNYAQNGEVDSYMGESRKEERKRGLLAWKEDTVEEPDDEDQGHTSFNCDDDDEMPGTELQSQPLLGETEKQSQPLLEETEKQSQPLLGIEKESEPLLSSSELEEQVAAPPVDSATSLAKRKEFLHKLGVTAPPDDMIKVRDEIIFAIRNELDQVKESLKCAICLKTMTDTRYFTCGHTMCGSCHTDYFNPKPQPKKRGEKQSPPRKVPNECPLCRTDLGKRNYVNSKQLDALGNGYKTLEKVFFFASSKYGSKVLMTQFEPESTQETEDDDDDIKMPANKKRIVDYEQHLEHLQGAKAVLDAFSARQDQKSQAIAKEQEAVVQRDLEIVQQDERYQALAKEQEAVVQRDLEMASNERETLSMRKSYDIDTNTKKRLGKQMLAAETAKAVTEFTSEVAKMKSNSTDANDDSSTTEEKQTAAVMESAGAETMDTAKAGNNIPSTTTNNNNADPFPCDESAIGSGVGGAIQSNLEIEQEDGSTVNTKEFLTANSKLESSQQEAASYSTAQTTAPIHDGNTAKKAAQPEPLKCTLREGTNVHDLERSPESRARESMATVATASSSPIVLHDGKTVKKAAKLPQPESEDKDPTPRRSGNINSLPAAGVAVQQQAEDEKEDEDVDFSSNADGGNDRGDDMPAPRLAAPSEAAATSSATTSTHQTTEKKEEKIGQGDIVNVQSRTWPGINKPGGVARVTKVHEGGNSIKYDVSYVLGGREKQVDEAFVTLKDDNNLSTIQEDPDESMLSTGTRSAEKKRPMRQRRAATKPESSAAVPIYNDEELKNANIPEDVLQWAGLPQPKKGKKGKAPGTPAAKKETKRGKKRALKDSNIKPKAKSATKKKKKASKKTDTTLEKDDQSNNTVEGLNDVLSPLSTEEIVSLADARYSSLLSLDEKQSSDTQTLYYVTSSLTDKDSKMLESLCKLLKGKSIILKINKDFNANKTQICFTPGGSSSTATKRSGDPTNVISKARTLKVMRSALAGLPILTPQWIEACLKEGNLVAPTGAHCIRTLPRKQTTDSDEEDFGVARYAAAYQKTTISSSNHFLSGVSVMLCGTTDDGRTIKDSKVLLEQAGASIISSVSMANRHLTDMANGESESDRFVFLCDDSTTNKKCGISDALFKQAKKVIEDSEDDEEAAIQCVSRNWLFDSISCVMPLESSAVYEPSAPTTKALFDLTTSEPQRKKGSRSRYESQIY